MYKIVAFLTLVYHFGFVISNFRTCVPNTQFILNDRLCYCDGNGHWTDASCLHVSHKQLCQPGQIVWHGCSQCTCQDNGRLLCNKVNCPDDKRIPATKGTIINNIGHWCTPLRIYYIDCSVCVCPQSGRTANIHCVKDSSCTALRTPSMTDLLETNKNTCRPKVLYVFYCLQCLCSDDGFFTMNNCVETCPSKPKAQSIMRTCTPHTFYKNECNVCLCPSDGIHSEASCTKEVCDSTHKFKVLQALTESKLCISHQFTTPICYYCQCNSDGTVNQQICLELDCLVMSSHENIDICNPGEIVPFCTQCFCLSNGMTQQEYCTTSCSYRSKIQVLEKAFKDAITKRQLDWNAFDTTSNALTCKQNTVYTENGKYCLCPDSQTKEKSCLVPVKKTFNFENPASQFTFKETKINIDFKKPCVPSTFIEFDCNTCFCSKNGTIDPNWCTYDDCESIRAVQNAQKVDREPTDKCNPGSIIRIDCNYCICPENGMSKDKECTKNRCADVEQPVSKDNIHCAPLEYYEVDCNVCFCPNDGVKNVAKCTKNVCDDNFLRSDECGPGRLFTEGCNICVCPPDGSRRDRVCTDNGCKKIDTTWKKIYQYTNSILEDLPVDVSASEKNLDLCFPGEEFLSDGLFCVCPEMGFKTYAACFSSVQDYDDVIKAEKDEGSVANVTLSLGIGDSFAENRPTEQNHGCYVQNNMTASVTGTKCVSVVGYIKGCQQCICSSEVDTIEYCRPLNTTECSTFGTLFFMRSIGDRPQAPVHEKIALAPHTHTRYKCAVNDTLKDLCHVCECEQDSLIREHCFTSTAAACVGVEPTFLRDKL